MKRHPIFFALLTGALILGGCGTRQAEESTGSSGREIKVAKPAEVRAKFDGYTINDVARYLSGRTEKLPEVFAKHVADARYQNVKRQLDAAWAKYEAGHLAPMRKWNEKVAPVVTEDIFYPFGGPDATHPATLYPKAKRYTLIGLEAFGQVPDPLQVTPAVAGARVATIHQAMRFVLGVNFFRTNSMRVQIGSNPYNGVVSILLLFLSRMDMEIIDAYPIAISPEGQLVPADTGVGKATGTRIIFRRPEGGALREMNFIQTNIADGGVASNPPLKAFLDGRRDVTTMLKAASFLLHRTNFSLVRQTILNQSKTIISDPSGMPFRFLNNANWKLTPYGNYIKTIPLFRARYEADRRRYYAKTKAEPLPFKYGYHPTFYSLIVAERTGQ